MPGMNERFVSNGLSLACHIARPSGAIEAGPAVILCHGFPIASLDAQRAGGTFPQLMDRTANELGCVAMTFNFRGCGESEGDFSLQGWVDDLRNAIAHLIELHEPSGVILLGTNTGGSIAICVAADDPRVCAAGLLSPRADFDDWADHPRRFLEHARDIGAIHHRDFPPSVEEWAREFRRFRPVASARRFAPRPMLVMHGEEDDSVPVSDARQLVNAHGSAELSLFEGAGHRLRHDPRAVAVLLGWLDRMRSTFVHPGDARCRSPRCASQHAPEVDDMPGMNERFVSNGLSLACHIARPSGAIEAGPAVILCHGFPIASLDAQRAGGTFPQLMDRTATRTRLCGDDVQLPGVRRERGRLLAAGLGRRPRAMRSLHLIDAARADVA